MTKIRPTLAQALSAAVILLAALLGLLFVSTWRTSRAAVLATSEGLRSARSDAIAQRVESLFAEAERSLDRIGSHAADAGAPPTPASLSPVLTAELLSHHALTEATFTRGGHDRESPWQVSALRTREGGIETRRVLSVGASFEAIVSPQSRSGPAPTRVEHAQDPTSHPTFVASVGAPSTIVWTDLHWSERDADRPEGERQVVVTMMKAALASNGVVGGVARVGLSTGDLDTIVREAQQGEEDPHRAFLCDGVGRLVTRPADGDAIVADGDDLRLSQRSVSKELAAALRLPELHGMMRDSPTRSARFESNGVAFLVTFRPLRRSQDWIVGVLVPESHYLGDLSAMRRRSLGIAGALSAAIAGLGLASFAAVRATLGRVRSETVRMRGFDFGPTPAPASPFRDVNDALDGLERAKTALRALTRYVPVDLVKQLYRSGEEPRLGGRLVEATLMFTDIKDFTSITEASTPDDLARGLGAYLKAMTAAVHATGGVVDKFIGDSLMVLWNVPAPIDAPEARACRAALECVRVGAAVSAATDWPLGSGFVTRVGIHRGSVMAGHFGAPERMSYTALGDAVNLASRLEGLNKVYGTSILVSEAVKERAGGGFAFRRLDRVAVKGKAEGIWVYELLGDAATPSVDASTVAAYEKAFDLYRGRAFAQAGAILDGLGDDAPSRALLARCSAFQREDPGPEWDGAYRPSSK